MTSIVDKTARNCATVYRWAVTRTIQQQSVAEHQFQVARISMRLLTIIEERWMGKATGASSEWTALKLAVIEYSLKHDDDEVLTGDIPGPSKRDGGPVTVRPSRATYVPDGPTAPLVKAVTKVADILEIICFVGEETLMGNRSMHDIAYDEKRLYKAVSVMCLEFDSMFPDVSNPTGVAKGFIIDISRYYMNIHVVNDAL